MPLLFSYGTLQQDDVQLATFGRLLYGQHDELPRFEPSVVRIEDAELAAADRYERLAAYTRVNAVLASGKSAWVYVRA